MASLTNKVHGKILMDIKGELTCTNWMNSQGHFWGGLWWIFFMTYAPSIPSKHKGTQGTSKNLKEPTPSNAKVTKGNGAYSVRPIWVLKRSTRPASGWRAWKLSPRIPPKYVYKNSPKKRHSRRQKMSIRIHQKCPQEITLWKCPLEFTVHENSPTRKHSDKLCRK